MDITVVALTYLHMVKIIFQPFIFFFLVVLFPFDLALATFTIHSKYTGNIQVKGFNGLSQTIVFEALLQSGETQVVDSQYKGLALLVFPKGQQYPLIIGNQSFEVSVISDEQPPVFQGSEENKYLYQTLLGGTRKSDHYEFAQVLIEARQLIESSYSISTIAQLNSIKTTFHNFVADHYQVLQYSDMLMRLIDQYFMMHEYVSYHVENSPATNIKTRFERAVIDGVGNWLKLLKPHIEEHSILNHCVSFYYRRSMVSLADQIISVYRRVSFCPGVQNTVITLPGSLSLRDAEGRAVGTFDTLSGEKILSFVSLECSVSMVETIIKAREVAARKTKARIVVVPLEKLSKKHLLMNQMVSSGNMVFVDDEQWRRQYISGTLFLPRFMIFPE